MRQTRRRGYFISKWNRAQFRHLDSDVGDVWPFTISQGDEELRALSHYELQSLAEALWHRVNVLSETMLNKAGVAKRAGMTVSWLDNSDSEKARRLRAVGIRYGSSQTSPIRFPLSKVIEICREDERGKGASAITTEKSILRSDPNAR